MTTEDSLKELDEKMFKLGMMPVSKMLKNHPSNPFIIHAGMVDLESFRKWLHMKHKEFLIMQAKMTVEASHEKDELFEWVLSHSAVFGEVIANFDAATSGEFKK
jgi:hypothetical protein